MTAHSLDEYNELPDSILLTHCEISQCERGKANMIILSIPNQPETCQYRLKLLLFRYYRVNQNRLTHRGLTKHEDLVELYDRWINNGVAIN